MSTKTVSFRLSGESLEVLQSLQNSDESLSKTARRVIVAALRGKLTLSEELNESLIKIEEYIQDYVTDELEPILKRLETLESEPLRVRSQTTPKLTKQDLEGLQKLAASFAKAAS